MIEELNEEPLHVCVCCYRKAPRYVAHCLELDLMGDGSTKYEAISRLKKIIEIQYRVYEARDTAFLANDIDIQWLQYHRAAPLGSPKEITFIMQKLRMTSDAEAVRVHVKIDKTPRVLTNKDSWCNEYPLHKLIKLLSTMRISWHKTEELDYGYFLGHWPAGSDGPLQSYPFYAPKDTMVRWYHLRSIASRFWLDDLRSRLLRDNENVEK